MVHALIDVVLTVDIWYGSGNHDDFNVPQRYKPTWL